MRTYLRPLALLAVLAACGSEPPPAPVAPPASEAPPAPVATVAPAPAKPAEPTPEEKKKAEAAKELEEDRAKWTEDHKAETARWTPELHAAAKALASKTFPNGKSAIQAATASKTRKPGNADRDKPRHPVETLDFFGFKPTMTVLDVGPGDGWYTELLAPVVAAKGKYMATSADPNGPSDLRPTFYAQRWSAFLATSPEAYGKVETIVVDGKAPKLGHEGSTDLVLIMRGVHGLINGGTLAAYLAEVKNVLKPNGVLGIEEHRALPDANPTESAKKGYVPEAYVIQQVEAAGFKLAAKSEINANPRDTKDYPDGVWTLPPVLRSKDKDREKYTAIGESDRMTLKFVKAPATPAAKAATPAPKSDKPAPATK